MLRVFARFYFLASSLSVAKSPRGALFLLKLMEIYGCIKLPSALWTTLTYFGGEETIQQQHRLWK
ncbi:MAG: hypothetical protein ACMUEK_00670 [Sodalis sp. (in: enterobacteria)]